ncbi:MAG: acetylglutamate kinase [Oscillospiraceae bacterium]
MKQQFFPLGDYVQLLQKENLLDSKLPVGADLTRKVALVSCNSQAVVPGTFFICKGTHFEGKYLQEAVAKGAFVYLSDTEYPEGAGAFRLPVSNLRRAMALLADKFYCHPSADLSVVGITGTKGKSSTTYYLKYIFDAFQQAEKQPESGVISSIDTYDGAERFESHLTTPEPLDLERHFRNAADANINYLTMEISSQALKYDRVVNVKLAAAVFLNIGTDHISPIEHPDFEDYFSSKLKIFEHSSLACVNLDSEFADRVVKAAEVCPRRITFSQNDPSADVYASNVRKNGGDIVFHVKTPRFSRDFRLTMPGLFNVQNALAAIAVCEGLNIPEQYVYVGLMKARVPGRMEVYTNADERIVSIVDYAHNKLSFQKLFESTKSEYPGRKIVIVFGCPGKKALDRRTDLGEIAGQYAQRVILTEEDSGEEDTESICREIAVHVEKMGCDYSIVPDRGEAIRQAVLSVEEPTVILITGKGAETRQKRGTAYIDCPSDVEYVQNFLKEFDLAHGLDSMEKVRSLLDLLPTLKAYEGKTIVLKYGGSALGENGTIDSILQDIAALRQLGARVVLVHGGGKNITALLGKLNVPTRFENGYRVTDHAALEVAELALSAQVNKQIVSALSSFKVKAVGISGKDGGLLQAGAKDEKLGLVGEISAVNPKVLETLMAEDFLPVVSPIAAGGDWGYNCNADDAARAIAEALHADKLIFLTDVEGILADSHNEKTLISHMTAQRARDLTVAGLIDGGMVPKVQGCVHAVENGVSKVVILDGRVEHALLLEALSQKSLGTTITEQ